MILEGILAGRVFMNLKVLLFTVICILFCIYSFCTFAVGIVDSAKDLADKGEYKEAYEVLLEAVEELQGDVDNLQGVVQYYKDKIAESDNPPEVVDYSYNQAANRLWATAWNLQHDGVFKKTGRDKEEYLQRSIDTYRRILIDYPYSNKAEEAQYRIGRIYYKFIKDYELAAKEYEKYVNMYPKGKFSSDAKQALSRIRKK